MDTQEILCIKKCPGLKAELKMVKKERDILRKVLTYFAGDQK